jgi:hypothetical protein
MGYCQHDTASFSILLLVGQGKNIPVNLMEIPQKW